MLYRNIYNARAAAAQAGIAAVLLTNYQHMQNYLIYAAIMSPCYYAVSCGWHINDDKLPSSS